MEHEDETKDQAIQDALEYAEHIINAVHEPLIILDENLKVTSVSRSFCEAFKVKPEETVGEYIYDLGNRQWDIAKLRELLEDILLKTTSLDDFEVEHVFPDIGKRILLLNARRVYLDAHRKKLILIAMEDITEPRKILDGLAVKIKQLETSLRAVSGKDHVIAGLKSMVAELERRLLRRR
ncbi:MAG: PAS domain-containing protein [Candidatus Omnitrophota bacterium]